MAILERASRQYDMTTLTASILLGCIFTIGLVCGYLLAP